MKKYFTFYVAFVSLLHCMSAQKMDRKPSYPTPMGTNFGVDFTHQIFNALGEIQVIGDAFCTRGEGSLIGFSSKTVLNTLN